MNPDLTLLSDKDLENRFDVRCINAVSSKGRLITGANGKSTPNYSHLGTGYQAHLDSKFAGYDVVGPKKLHVLLAVPCVRITVM